MSSAQLQFGSLIADSAKVAVTGGALDYVAERFLMGGSSPGVSALGVTTALLVGEPIHGYLNAMRMQPGQSDGLGKIISPAVVGATGVGLKAVLSTESDPNYLGTFLKGAIVTVGAEYVAPVAFNAVGMPLSLDGTGLQL